YYIIGDGGGGITRYWDSASVEDDDGGAIIKPTAIDPLDPGRWIMTKTGAVSVKWYGAKGDNITDDFTPVETAYFYARTNSLDLYFPSGQYYLSGRIEWGTLGTGSTLIDCNNVTIYGDGRTSLVRTEKDTGADVFNLNRCSNLSIRDLAITSDVAGTGSGSNGVSVTNGWDNVTLDNLYVYDLGSVDAGAFVDGGRAVSLQPGSVSTAKLGAFKATRIHAKGCTDGFGYDGDLDRINVNHESIDVEVEAIDCYIGVKFSAAGAAAAIPADMDSNMRIVATTVNCQQDLVLSRLHGASIDLQLAGDKSLADLRLDPSGRAWRAADTIVSAVDIFYAHKSNIIVRGKKENTEYKTRIGGATAGSSGLQGSTKNSVIDLDIGGTASVNDILVVDSGGNKVDHCVLAFSDYTAAAIPTELTDPAKFNEIQYRGQDFVYPGRQGWTPFLTDTSLVEEDATYTTRYGQYNIKDGRVDFLLYISASSLGTLTPGDALFIGGLPFPSLVAGGNIASCSIGQLSNMNLGAAAGLVASVTPGASTIRLDKMLYSSLTGMGPQLTVAEVAANFIIAVSGFYYTY
ncbi:MAG: glycosyl hydrolase family 28-related protein, partial [Planctomycetota bacterium]